MCQRYALPDQTAAEHEFQPSTAWWKFAAKFNVAAEQYVPAVRLHDAHSEAVMLRWGFIPSWHEGNAHGPPKTCIRRGYIEQSNVYGPAWRNAQRCILAVAGFYTWRLTADRYRQPFFVRLNERSVFGVAALWDRWISDEDDVIESCSIITVSPNELMADVADAGSGMPAILRRKHYRTWLEGSVAEAGEVLRPYRSGWMQAYPVSPRINSFAVDDPALIRAAG